MKIGILGGTFDPIHEGHCFIARRVRELWGLERVLFMVARFPPHQDKTPVSSPFHRYAMCVLGVSNSRHLLASQWELRQRGPSYTVQTMQSFTQRYPHHQFCFIAGSDSLRELHSWKNCDKLLTEHCLTFVQRPGAETDLKGLSLPAVLEERIRCLGEHEKPDVRPGRSYLIQLEAPSVSSSDIRQLIFSGKRPSSHSLGSDVYRYIRKYHLYEPNQKDIAGSLSGG